MSALEDRFAIVDALNLLARLFDARAWDRVGEVMAPEVVAYDCHGLASVVTDSLRAHLGGCGLSQHLLANHEVVVDGDRAASITKARVYHQGLGERADRFFECLGDYHDTWERTPDGWRMTTRRFDVHVMVGDFAVLQPG